MRSAIYYPHTHFYTENLLKTSLLLWDRVHFLIPFEGFSEFLSNTEAAKGYELIGSFRVPSEEEKQKAHEFVEDFVTRPLPAAFEIPVQDEYFIYSEKFMPETWNMLANENLVKSSEARAPVSMAQPTALVLMSLLTDCCAGNELARITDKCSAYASLSGLFVESDGARDIQTAREQLIPVPLSVADLSNVSLSKLVKFREREEISPSGYRIRELRHRFLDSLDAQARAYANAKSKADRVELKRQFVEDMKDDYKSLNEALTLEGKEILTSKEVIVSVIAALTIGLGGPAALALPPVLSGVAGATITLGGLLGSKSKFVKTRHKLLREHPMSYLYELSGGIRF